MRIRSLFSIGLVTLSVSTSAFCDQIEFCPLLTSNDFFQGTETIKLNDQEMSFPVLFIKQSFLKERHMDTSLTPADLPQIPLSEDQKPLQFPLYTVYWDAEQAQFTCMYDVVTGNQTPDPRHSNTIDLKSDKHPNFYRLVTDPNAKTGQWVKQNPENNSTSAVCRRISESVPLTSSDCGWEDFKG